MLLRAFASMNRLRTHLPIILIACMAGIQALLASGSLTFLITNILPDDAFYYFKIAQALASGHGSTFDGLTLTNGYHPLWMIVLVPIYSLTQFFGWGLVAPMRIALMLSIACNIGTALLLYRIISTCTTSSFIRVFSLGLCILNPFFLFETINGLETALSLLLCAAFFTLALSHAHSTRALGVLGAVGGLMVLARIDTIFYLGAVGLSLLSLPPYQPRLWVRRLAPLVLGAAMSIVPFLIYNLVTYGMFLTSASGANTLVNHTLIVQDHGASILQTLKAAIYNTDLQVRELVGHLGAGSVVLFMLGGGWVLLLLGHARAWSAKPTVRMLGFFALGFVLMFLSNVAIRFTARTWYFVFFGFLVAIVVALILELIRTHAIVATWQLRAGSCVLVCLTLFSFFVNWHKDLRDRFVGQRDMYETAEWINTTLPEGVRVGVFNAGIIGYFSTATVVNLDGLVNNDAFAAMKERDLLSYMKRAHLSYVAEFDIYLSYRYRSFFGVPDIHAYLDPLVSIGSVPHSRSSTGLTVYRFSPEPLSK